MALIREQCGRRGRTFLDAPTGVQPPINPLGLAAFLQVGDVRLRDTNPSADRGLCFPTSQGSHDLIVPGLGHLLSLLHRREDRKGTISPSGLNLDERAAKQKEFSAVMGIADTVGEQRSRRSLRVRLNPPVSKAVMDAHQDGSESVGDPDSDTAFLRVDFDGALPIKQGGEIGGKRLVRKVFYVHVRIIGSDITEVNASMAVPVMRWIGERIQMIDDLIGGTS